MKRLWIGIGFLAVTFAIGCCLCLGFRTMHQPISEDLSAASQAALDGDWDSAADLTTRAADRWNRVQHLSAAATDHEIMEEINALFSQLQVLLRQRATTGYAQMCAQLTSLTEEMSNSQSINWWRIL